MSNKTYNHKLLDIRGIRFKTWLYSFLLTALILAVLLLLQITTIARYYQNYKLNDVERAGANIADAYTKRQNDESFMHFIQQAKNTSDVDVVVFSLSYTLIEGKFEPDNQSFMIYFNSTKLSKNDLLADVNFFAKLLDKDEISHTSTTGEQLRAIYGTRVQDAQNGTVFIHVSSVIQLSSITISAIQRQAVLTTIICAGLSLLLSWLVSKAIVKPITQFSKDAQRLAKGDYSVRFDGGGLSEIENLAQALNYATDEMAKTESLRKDLLANVSHDLRTPLTMVKAYAEMIRDLSGADPKKRISHSQTIIDEADRLTLLVNDIQNLSKLQSGTSVLELKSVNLSTLCKRVLETFQIYSSKENYKFETKIEEQLIVIADESKIEQVLYNLIGNAINYTGEDKKIKVYLKKHENRAYFGVQDSGKGIAKEEQDSVWERYYRAGQSKRTRVGTGLGLSIVKSILYMHGAKSGIISSLGKGSTFWFSLPLGEARQPQTIFDDPHAFRHKLLKK